MNRYQKIEAERQQIFKLYLQHSKQINNWDLVDCSAHKIVGHWLFYQAKNDVLFELAHSNNLWQRRIAMVACWYFTKQNHLELPLEIALKLLSDKEDLMHKAVGWMLREVGKQDILVLKNFLKAHYPNINRTTLRYAIEKFPESERLSFLRGEF